MRESHVNCNAIHAADPVGVHFGPPNAEQKGTSTGHWILIEDMRG